MTRRHTADLAAIVLLAPAVVALRWPAMLAEMSAAARPESSRAVAEKLAAAAEGMAAAQMAILAAGSRIVLGAATGTWRPWLAAEAADAAFAAAIRPVARTVRANHRRLARR